MLLTDANHKWCIVMNNAYYGLNLPKFLEKQHFADDKITFWGACKVLISA